MTGDQAFYRVGITRDCLKGDGSGPIFDPAALALLDRASGISYEFLPEAAPAITPAAAARYDAIMALMPAVTRASLAGSDLRLRHVARFGSGFDNVDVAACTDAGVLVTIAPDGVRRPVATAILTFILALAQKLPAKDRLTREGRWAERTGFMGQGLTGRTVGSIGFGSIAREAFRLLAPLEVERVAYSPRADPAAAAQAGVRLVDFETLLRGSDFLTINCPLTAETRGMIGARELALMKPTAHLVNTGRGPIVDERALYEALKHRRIAGAALDVFAEEPTPPDNPILALDNVIVTPHSLCWTDECFRRCAESAFGAIVDVSRGRQPAYPVNPAAFGHARWSEGRQAR
jgi:D-3-phosphoglycerate dehydrogenase